MEEEFNNVFMIGYCLCTLNCPRQVSHFTLARGGVCMFSGYCPYGGLDNIVSCIECDELLADKRKRDQFVRLAQEVVLELSVVGDQNKLYRESLTAQHDAMKKVIDVLLI